MTDHGVDSTAAPSSVPARDVRLASLADRARALSNTLDEALRGADVAWGNDIVGLSFAAAHAGPADRAAEQLRGLAGRISGVDSGFRADDNHAGSS